MKRRVRVAAALAACVFLSGCAASRPEARKEEPPPGVSVRLPVAEAATLSIESQPPLGHPELPLSVADESRGRWLTLFEVNYSPVRPPPPLSPSIEEGPSR
jgi:hypothetical protein